MATALSTATDQPKSGNRVAVTAGNKLAAFVPQSLEEAWRLSGAIAASGMTPKTYGNDQNKVMVGIMAGAELGLTPFAALQSIAVINGNPSLWGDGMLGLVEASGLLEDFEETDDGKVATCRAVRKGRKTPSIRTFSVDDAKAAGLSGKQGPWQQYPKRMRQLRARSFALRDGFSDVLKGVKSAEEVRDYAPMDGGTLASATSVTAALIEQQAQVDEDGVFPGPADDQRGEAHADDLTTVEGIAEAFAAASDIDAVGDVQSRAQAAIDDMSVADKTTVFNARNAALEALRGGGK